LEVDVRELGFVKILCEYWDVVASVTLTCDIEISVSKLRVLIHEF
jgi:hypothetical protein